MQAVAAISITVALLGGPIFPGGVAPTPSQLAQVVSGQLVETQLPGQQVTYDSAAGLTTILGPDWETIRWTLFSTPYLNVGGIPPPSLAGKGMALAIQSKAVKVGEEQSFDFPWPAGRPQYYLEQVEPDLYRRIELVDKEGYMVSVQPTGGPDELTVQVEFANKTLSGGKYDETIRAFVGRPTLIKAIVTATAPLTKGQKTLLVWQPRSEMMWPGGAPDWAVGEWGMMSEPGTGAVIIQRDGTVLGEGGGVSLSGSIDPSGRVSCKGIVDGKTVAIVTGKLSPNGTGQGTAYAEGETIPWTATHLRAGEPALAGPEMTPGGMPSGIPAQSAPTLRVLDGGARPKGVAVLLEVTAPPED